VAARLRERRGEIEQALLARMYAIAEPSETADPDYVEGLRAAFGVALDYGLAAIELGEERTPPPPPTLFWQARLAARNGVSLDTVLRRYFAGYTLIGDFLIGEAEGELPPSSLKRLLRTQAVIFDRLLTAVSEEYTREAASPPRSSGDRHVKRVQRLLAGELVDTSGLAYNFQGHHLGAIATGSGAAEALQTVGRKLDCLFLIVPEGEEVAWAWFGGRCEIDAECFESVLISSWPARLTLALGEPERGLAGWRLTHRQARAALTIALRGPEHLVRYADVALLAATVQDDLVAAFLRKNYLAPLDRGRDGGSAARKTLRAYFAAERNISCAASALRISRQAVAKRLRAIEETLGCTIDSRAIELEAALRLDELEAPAEAPQSNAFADRTASLT
jgi:PucR C-terminal helix-turn-helix domain